MAALFILFSVSTGSAQQPVEVQAKIKGDLLHLELVTRGDEPTLRMNPNPKFLELTFPKGTLKGAPLKKAIDKGLVQKVSTLQSENGVRARIYVVSKPKAKLVKTAEGYRYTVNMQEMAKAPNRTASKPAKPGPTASKTTKKPSTRVISNPKPGPSGPISITFQNTPLKTAVAQMASKVGLKAQVDPSLVGAVNGTFSGTPFNQAMDIVMKRYSADFETVYTPTSVVVRAKKPVATKATKPTATTPTKPVATSQPSQPSQPTAATAPATIVREYFPYKKKKAQRAFDAAKLAFPNVSYMVDPVLNVLLVEGSASDIRELEKFLREQSPK